MIRRVDSACATPRIACLALLSALALTACRPSEPVPVQAHALKKSELSPAEIKYGRAAKRDRSVTYGRDVVIVDGGPDAIRSQGADGLTWTLDARARHADEIAVGKIAFVTGRCVGRVLAAERTGSDLRVVLGPAELTDLFQRLDVSATGIALDPADAIEQPLLQLPDMKWPLDAVDGDGPERVRLVKMRSSDDVAWPASPRVRSVAYGLAATQVPGATGILPVLPPIRFQAQTPLKKEDGPGTELRYGDDARGVRIAAQAQLYLKKPSVDFHLRINLGDVDATLVLHNAAGLRLAFDSAVSDQFSGNINWYAPAGGFAVQLSGTPPLALNIRNDLWVQTVFSARQSVFNAAGEYEFNADVGFTFRNKQFTFQGPKGLTVRRSPMADMNGVSLGPRGLLLRHTVSMTVGVGLLSFTVGPMLAIGTSAGVAMGSDIGIVQCRGASVSLQLKGGMGWTIPRAIASFVNAFLSIFKVKGIPDHGDYSTPWHEVASQYARSTSPICGGA
jgi:hypothetical protein